MRYIGLDVAYRNVGVVVLDHAGVLVSRQHLECACARDPDGFRWHMDAADSLFQPDDVVTIEGLSFGSVGRLHVLAAAYTVWLEAAVRMTTLVFVVAPTRTKLWAVDRGKATKAEMKAWARAELGMAKGDKPVLSEHEADALSLAQVARAGDRVLRGQTVLLTARQRGMLQNPKGDGVLQRLDQSLFVGQYGQRYRLAG